MIKGLIYLYSKKYGLLVFLLGVFIIVSITSAIMMKNYLQANNGVYNTYYVRTDGGTATQCTGLVDSAYSGSGTGQACAWSSPMIALPASGSARISAGDTLNIASGSYDISAQMIAVPSGSSIDHPTKIIGQGFETKSTELRPQLIGRNGITSVISLESSSNVEVKWLELTDNSNCALTYPTPHDNPEGFIDLKCSRIDPSGYAKNGLYASDSTNVLLSGLDIHGLSSGGVYAGRLTNWTVEDVDIIGNAFGGWNFDINGSGIIPGPMVFRHLRIEWNGCVETLQREVGVCFSQGQGNYGDGIGTAKTGGDWLFEDSIISHNTQDGLDLVYHNLAGTITLNRVRAEGNAGNQIKTTGNTVIINSEIIDNCYYFMNQDFTMPSYHSPQDSNPDYMATFTHCRGGNGAISISSRVVKDGLLDYTGETDTYTLINNTVHGVFRPLIFIGPRDMDWFSGQSPTTTPTCTQNTNLVAQNNIFLGGNPGGQLPETFSQSSCDAMTSEFKNNTIFRTRNSSVPAGNGNTFTSNPLLVSVPTDYSQYLTTTNNDSYDLRPSSNSPAINKISGTRGTDFPAVDFLSNDRPEPDGTLADIGAYEYGSSGGLPVINELADVHGYINKNIITSPTYANVINANSYQWINLSGPENGVLNISSSTTLTPTFSANLVGQYSIKLTATNTVGSVDAIVSVYIHKAGDINGDGVVNSSDFFVLLANWGTPLNFMANTDVSEDGLVNSQDFFNLLANWG